MYGNYSLPDINKIDSRFIICDHIRLEKSKRKGAELSYNSMGKSLHKVFKSVVN